jgi:hypothetical protein
MCKRLRAALEVAALIAAVVSPVLMCVLAKGWF